ncbi:MAG: S1C family serine protease [Pirellulales bacterium]|nr:S1C family serine protease [Pirellulales bacterium]
MRVLMWPLGKFAYLFSSEPCAGERSVSFFAPVDSGAVRPFRSVTGWLLVLLVCLAGQMVPGQVAAGPWQSTIREAQSKVVKIYGAGGLRRMEAYQTGILVSPQGHVLTAWSYVLDTADLLVVLDDGRKWLAELVGHDPTLELALIKLPLEGAEVSYFDLEKAATRQAYEGQRVLALSNLYGIATGDEPVSVLHGVVTALAPLDARGGVSQANYRGQVYVVDASANNPGAAGGALVDYQGGLLGVLGKELRSRVTGTWLNYALPVASVHGPVRDLIAGRKPREVVPSSLPAQPTTPENLGLILVPNVLQRTPPYVDSVRMNSAAELVGLRANDLVVFVAAVPVSSCQAVIDELRLHDRREELAISVLRDGMLLEYSLLPRDRQATKLEESPPTAAPTSEAP